MKNSNGSSLTNRHKSKNYDINKNKIKTKTIHDNLLDNTLDDNELPIPQLSFIQSSSVVFCLSILCFWNAQYATFAFDDNSAILKNKDILPETSIWKTFENDFWGTNIKSNLSHKSYRPLTVLTFRLNHYLSEGLDPWSFHFVNILLHAFNSVLWMRVISILLEGVSIDNNGKRKFGAPKVSLLCGVLFAIHPIHTESVAATVGRADLLCGIFMCFSFLSYTEYTYTVSYLGVTSWKHLFLSILCAGCAMFSKEQGITVIGLIIAYDVLMIQKINLGVIKNIWSINEKKKSNTQPMISLKLIFLMTLSGVVLFLTRLWIMASPPPAFQYNDNPHSFQKSFLMRVLNYNYLYSINLWLLLCPWWLCFDWAMGCIPVIESIVDARLLAPLVMWIVLISSAVKILSMLDSPIGRCFAISFAFLVIPFIPSMNIFFRVGFVIAERNLYFPSVGYIMLLAIVLLKLGSTEVQKKIKKTVLALLIVIFIWRSIQRTNDWLSEETLFQSGLQVCPLNAKVHYNVGKNLHDHEKEDEAIPYYVEAIRYYLEAIRYYLEAIRLSPTYDQPMNNLGNIYKDKKMLKEAEYYHQMSVTVNPIFATGWMNLGTIKADLKEKDEKGNSQDVDFKNQEAIACYQKAVKHRKKYPDAYYNWGNLHIDYKEYDLAIEKYKIAINLKNEHQQAWQNMLMALGDAGRGDELIEVSSKAMKIYSTTPNVVHIIGNSLGTAGKLEEAEKYLKESVKLQPNSSNAHATLAVLYHRTKRYKEAEYHYEQAIKLDLHNKAAQENYDKLKRVWKK